MKAAKGTCLMKACDPVSWWTYIVGITCIELVNLVNIHAYRWFLCMWHESQWPNRSNTRPDGKACIAESDVGTSCMKIYINFWLSGWITDRWPPHYWRHVVPSAVHDSYQSIVARLRFGTPYGKLNFTEEINSMRYQSWCQLEETVSASCCLQLYRQTWRSPIWSHKWNWFEENYGSGEQRHCINHVDRR